MAGKKTSNLSDLVFSKLDQSEQMHFNYHNLFLNNIDLKDGNAVTAYIQNKYMGGLSLEEFALNAIIQEIKSDIGKVAAKHPVKSENKKN